MNDNELDEILNKWESPVPSDGLRTRILAPREADQRSSKTGSLGFRLRWPVFAAAGLAAFLLIAAHAVPQTRSFFAGERAPYQVDSEFLRYTDQGSPTVELYTTSYNADGSERQLSKMIPDNVPGTVATHVLETGQEILIGWFHAEHAARMRQLARVDVGCQQPRCFTAVRYLGNAAELLSNGCVAGVVTGHETILDYPTVAVRRAAGEQHRMTLWMAPGLGCFALRIVTEEKQPDGSFRKVEEKRALRVTVNR